ncbi:hypothetical protein JR316_0004564 [Psilocybe cubensis]|uniref:Pentatricopeptide repeat protein n=2 Tax=Psilocybe cubensis TaxID=181762 RepID=A0A8H7Y040_PSICU|nr:hypothetical protein JR316_0004564 [Psilocybe cubensis]KAH9482464.1 hypothetical protein JR316_0004564 [Psilocybe cubensis]
MGQAVEENTVLEHPAPSILIDGRKESVQQHAKAGEDHLLFLPSEVSTVATSPALNQPASEVGSQPENKAKRNVNEIRRRPERQAVQERPTYATGRPWSADPIARVVIPDKINHLLRNIENGLKKAHATYQRLLKEKEQRRRLARKSITTRSSGQTTESSPEAADELAEFANLPPLDIITHLRENLDTLGTSDSVDDSWASYTYLLDTISCHPIIYNRIKCIPYSHLHRFVRLLSRNRPRTHLQYLRLLSVMTYIIHVGGTLKQPEWNALIDHIGAGRRTTVAEDMQKALAAFKSISAGRLPGSSDFEIYDAIPPSQFSFEPDVYTMTILLSLAARAHDSGTLKQISNAMVQTGIMPNRITHLSLLRYFTEKRDLSGVRRTLQKMKQNDLELGVDGLNACIWAYGYNTKLDMSLMIYRALRYNTLPPGKQALENIQPILLTLQDEYIVVEPGMVPNEVTYTALIQIMAYHGQFVPAIKIFVDLLSTNNVEYGAPLESLQSDAGKSRPLPYTPTIAIYRAIFLGFSKHGKHPSLVRDPDELDWTLKNLFELFNRFLTMPKDTHLTHSVVYIIITAFVQTSGGDMDIVRQAWTALDERFGIVFHKEHSQSRLMKIKQQLFPDAPQK